MTYNILVVDDSATTRAVIKRTIQLAGVPASLYEAPDGHAALAQLDATPMDLVLADLHMPGMSGIELVRRTLARRATRSVPVVVITAEPNASRLEELKREGVRGCVRKPFTPEEIRGVINEILGAAHA